MTETERQEAAKKEGKKIADKATMKEHIIAREFKTFMVIITIIF